MNMVTAGIVAVLCRLPLPVSVPLATVIRRLWMGWRSA